MTDNPPFLDICMDQCMKDCWEIEVCRDEDCRLWGSRLKKNSGKCPITHKISSYTLEREHLCFSTKVRDFNDYPKPPRGLVLALYNQFLDYLMASGLLDKAGISFNMKIVYKRPAPQTAPLDRSWANLALEVIVEKPLQRKDS